MTDRDTPRTDRVERRADSLPGNAKIVVAADMRAIERELAEAREDAARFRFWSTRGFCYYRDMREWLLTDERGKVIAKGEADNLVNAIDAAMKEGK